jgi:hypothetical protein
VDEALTPSGWRFLDPAAARGLSAELARELAPGHALEGVSLVAVAARLSQDDVLYRHVHDPRRFSVVHLTFASERERDPHWPSVEYDGDLDGFLAYARAAALAEGAEPV